MKKAVVAITVLLFCNCFLHAQKTDYVWLTGYSSAGRFDSSFNYWFGISKFDFNQHPVAISYDSLGINLTEASATISDNNGNVLFYSNGVSIRNYLDEVLVDTLGNNWYLNNIWGWYYYGNPYPQVQIVLPNPITSNLYDVFLMWVDTLEAGASLVFKKLLRTQIDMNSNFAHGTLEYKDRVVSEGWSAGCLTATKHGNGKDWWIITKEVDNDCYDILRYDGSDSIHKQTQCDGFVCNLLETVTLRFSEDGNFLASANKEKGKLCIFDFNRCDGTLNLREEVNVPEMKDSTDWWLGAVTFSSNSRYAYLSIGRRVFQYDVTAVSIANSRQTVGVFVPGGPAPLNFYHSQLAPDGKIYICSSNTTYYIAVINHPDEAGILCNFQNPVQVPSFIHGLPYYPNYRLGALSSSLCDSLTGISNVSEKEKILKLFPNPATDFVVVDYGFTNWSKGDVAMEITNELGQVVHAQKLPRFSGFQKVDVSALDNGMYNVSIKRGAVTVAINKFVKQ